MKLLIDEIRKALLANGRANTGREQAADKPLSEYADEAHRLGRIDAYA